MPRCRKDYKHPRGADWQKIHGKRFTGDCAKCGKHGQKSDLIPLCIRITEFNSHRILCHLCPDCLATLAHELGVEIPE